ncbi:hypothetical protein DSM3645_03378 [Blastopirellula marina DSM 3645]|uniref:Uncharacterized protein n=1 Tax=Blastopirellula marina DSM 3645 TaxID=314230 RepID=A3ZVY9_9BACT|nr:hypothetical protein DSM3645_03378 [Blastopirellula marina DSM 3645]
MTIATPCLESAKGSMSVCLFVGDMFLLIH